MANIIDYIPPVLHDIKDVKNICAAIDTELDRLQSACDKTYDNQFFDTMDESTCLRWENVMGIGYDSTYTLADRKVRIKNKFVEQLPYTKNTLNKMLSQMCGEDGYSLNIDNDTYTITIKIALASKKSYQDVVDTIERIIPANMILDVSIKYNSHETLSQFTHEKLADYTHTELRNEILS